MLNLKIISYDKAIGSITEDYVLIDYIESINNSSFLTNGKYLISYNKNYIYFIKLEDKERKYYSLIEFDVNLKCKRIIINFNLKLDLNSEYIIKLMSILNSSDNNSKFLSLVITPNTLTFNKMCFISFNLDFSNYFYNIIYEDLNIICKSFEEEYSYLIDFNVLTLKNKDNTITTAIVYNALYRTYKKVLKYFVLDSMNEDDCMFFIDRRLKKPEFSLCYSSLDSLEKSAIIIINGKYIYDRLINQDTNSLSSISNSTNKCLYYYNNTLDYTVIQGNKLNIINKMFCNLNNKCEASLLKNNVYNYIKNTCLESNLQLSDINNKKNNNSLKCWNSDLGYCIQYDKNNISNQNLCLNENSINNCNYTSIFLYKRNNNNNCTLNCSSNECFDVTNNLESNYYCKINKNVCNENKIDTEIFCSYSNNNCNIINKKYNIIYNLNLRILIDIDYIIDKDIHFNNNILKINNKDSDPFFKFKITQFKDNKIIENIFDIKIDNDYKLQSSVITFEDKFAEVSNKTYITNSNKLIDNEYIENIDLVNVIDYINYNNNFFTIKKIK